VRLKRTIEIRAADAQSPPTAYALPALYAGLFYDKKAEDELDGAVAHERRPHTIAGLAEPRGQRHS